MGINSTYTDTYIFSYIFGSNYTMRKEILAKRIAYRKKMKAIIMRVLKDYNSYEELAGELGVSRQAVSDWKKGKYLPRVDIIMKILMDKKFNVTLEDLGGYISGKLK